MNRRQFVVTTAFGTLSLSLTPQLLEAKQSTPTSQQSDPWVTGNAFDLLSTEGEPETLAAVVEPVMFSNSSYAVVLRSYYSQPIAITDIFGTVRNREGSLVATVEDAYFAPAIIEPNAVCIVGVSFDSDLSSSEQRSVAVELDYETDLDLSDTYAANLRVTDFVIRPERIIGVVENTTSSEISLGWIVGVLFDHSGQLATWFSTTTDKWDIPAGETSTFSKSFDVRDDMMALPHLVASRGTSF